MNRQDPGGIVGTVSWLEDEYREHRVTVGRLQQQVEQLSAMVQQQALELRVLEDTNNGLRAQVGRLAKLEENLNQLSHQVVQLQTEASTQSQRTDKFERQYQLDLERLRQGSAELWQRIDLLQKDLDPMPVRILSIAENYKKQQESMTVLQQRVEAIQAGQKSVADRAELLGEQIRHGDQEMMRLDREIEPLRRQDESLGFRVQTAIDMARRIDEQIANVLAEEKLRRDLAERIEVQRVHQDRLVQQVGELQQLLQGQGTQLEEVYKRLKGLDDRALASNERSASLQQQIIDVRAEYHSRLSDLLFLLGEAKRRQIGQGEQELKEIKGFKIEPRENQDA